MKKVELKKLLLTRTLVIGTFLVMVSDAVAEDKFYLNDFEVAAGESKQLAIQFESSKVSADDPSQLEYVAFQFDIYLPEGLTITKKKGKYNFSFNEDRYDDHTFTSAEQADGAIRVAAASLTNSSFWETSGDFIYFTVTVADDFVGIHEIEMKNIKFSTGGSQVQRSDLFDVTSKVLGPAVSSINISSANKWSTCVLQFDAALPTGVKAYTSDRINGEYLILNEATSLKAYTPYVLYAENGYEGTLTGTLNVDDYKPVVSDGLLSGAISIQRVSAGYVLQNQGNGVMFHKISGQTFTIPAGKCWLEDTVSGIATVRISTGATGIEEIENDELPKNEIIYSLDGQVVKNPVKGQIYIIGGKKVLKM